MCMCVIYACVLGSLRARICMRVCVFALVCVRASMHVSLRVYVCACKNQFVCTEFHYIAILYQAEKPVLSCPYML